MAPHWHKMRELISSSVSSSQFKNSFLQIIYLINYVLFNFVNPKSFGLLSSGIYGNTPASSNFILLNIEDFGARGDGCTDDTKTLQDVWKLACSLSSPAKIIIPAKKSYHVRPTNFSGPCLSKVTLQISGVIVAPQDPEVWSGLDVHKWLYFHGVDYLTVEGDGKINGMGQEWWARSCKTNTSNLCTHAPTSITFHKCSKLQVRNITLANSQQMHMAFTSCVNVGVSGVKILSPADSPNTDGIHISASTEVDLTGIAVSTGDDCISIVSNSSKIRVKDIFCGPGHGISIGSLGKHNSSAAVQDVVVDGATFIDTKNGVRIKTWQGGSGFARKITFQNIQMHNVSHPIIINQYYCDSTLPCPNQTSSVSIDSVIFRNIKGTSATEEAIILSCSDDYPCTRLFLEDIQLEWVSGVAKAFCWEAYGTSLGLVRPSPCVDALVRQTAKSYSMSMWIYDYAFF
ncbi:probable polygalacturonase At1g80170 isoform X1 [Primulina eburnea]|uniref:probable polygalacturonase At1g80170 isoform X1 n=1 Tax=Primulina eburnea TaxID=1245227 RepID=UPI003C6C0DAE